MQQEKSARKKPFMDSLKLSSFVGSGLKETPTHWFFSVSSDLFQFNIAVLINMVSASLSSPSYWFMQIILQCKLTWEFSNWSPLPWWQLISRDKNHPEILEWQRPFWDTVSPSFDRWRKWEKWFAHEHTVRGLPNKSPGFLSPTLAVSTSHYEDVTLCKNVENGDF